MRRNLRLIWTSKIGGGVGLNSPSQGIFLAFSSIILIDSARGIIILALLNLLIVMVVVITIG